MLEISQNFVTLSEYMNFTILQMHLFTTKLFTGVTEPHEDFFLFVSVYNFPAEKTFGYTIPRFYFKDLNSHYVHTFIRCQVRFAVEILTVLFGYDFK